MSIKTKILQSLLFACLIGLFSGVSTSGQQNVRERMENLYAEFVELYQAGKYTEALVPARRLFELSEKALGPEHPNVATVLNAEDSNE